MPGARPVRLPMRKRCVSTAMVGSPNAMLRTTLAVLRPTPGSASSASREARHRAVVLRDQLLRQRDDVLRLVAIKPDRLDVVAHALLAERDHFFRRVGGGEQRGRRLVDAGIGRLRRQHDRDQQREGVDVREFAARIGMRSVKAAERFLDIGRRPAFRLFSASQAGFFASRGDGFDGLFRAFAGPFCRAFFWGSSCGPSCTYTEDHGCAQ